MNARMDGLIQRRVTVGREWEAARARDDLAGMDAAMDQIRAISCELRSLAEAPTSGDDWLDGVTRHLTHAESATLTFTWIEQIALVNRGSCAISWMPGVSDVPTKAWSLKRGHAHTHSPDAGLAGARSVICIRKQDMYQRGCSCGLSFLLWHEVAHAAVPYCQPAHGPEWEVMRIALGHGGRVDVSGQRLSGRP